jgi:hypothetical protein
VGKLIYLAITSLDGYIEDAAGKFAWAEPVQRHRLSPLPQTE